MDIPVFEEDAQGVVYAWTTPRQGSVEYKFSKWNPYTHLENCLSGANNQLFWESPRNPLP